MDPGQGWATNRFSPHQAQGRPPCERPPPPAPAHVRWGSDFRANRQSCRLGRGAPRSPPQRRDGSLDPQAGQGSSLPWLSGLQELGCRLSPSLCPPPRPSDGPVSC